jgi:hypothetical protein
MNRRFTPIPLLRSRRDLDPCFWARGNGRIVGPGAGAVVPVPLRRRGRSRLLLDVDRRLLNDDRRRWVHVVRRRVPVSWTPPKRGRDVDEDSAVPAPMVPAEARRGGNEKQRDRQKRYRRQLSHSSSAGRTSSRSHVTPPRSKEQESHQDLSPSLGNAADGFARPTIVVGWDLTRCPGCGWREPGRNAVIRRHALRSGHLPSHRRHLGQRVAFHPMSIAWNAKVITR